ncbi:NPCBM/NEW2 domain-containing protein [Nonomuraea sp. NPDC003727]
MRALRQLLSGFAATTLLSTALASAGLAATVATAAPAAAAAVDDGLALTPPMGFNNWNSTHCRAEFNEEMVKGIADLFVSKGLKDAGYQYVNLDDCWALPQRDQNGNLVPDPVRFPHGIKAVADYVHSKGLKFGIYTSAGTRTCDAKGFPGGIGHERQDANLFASWGVDYLKYDNCGDHLGQSALERYTTMRDALRASGRPIVFSICEWGSNQPWLWAQDVGHLWRTTGDISDSWSSMLDIMKRNLALAQYAKPGAWNDPDMLEVGNGGMTDTEYRTHFSMWSIMAAPLLIGSDLRRASGETFDILLNKEVIAVDQDPLGIQGSVLKSEGGRWVVVKPLANGDKAVALFNESDRAQRVATSVTEIGLADGSPAYRVRDLWTRTDTHTEDVLAATVPAHGTVMLRVSKDAGWARYAPAVELSPQGEAAYPDGPVLAHPGKPLTLTTTAVNHGHVPAQRLSVRVSAPEGWKVEATSPTTKGILAPGRTFRTTWKVTAPADASSGHHEVTATLDHTGPGGRPPARTTGTAGLLVPPTAPTGSSYLSDVAWLSSTNGWGPVERDRSVGEDGSGDGGPLTVGGAVYAKGLGVHAPSTVEYYIGGACTQVTAVAGLDDEAGTRGTAAFEIWADGRKVASTEVMTNAMPGQRLTADISGAALLRLVVTDGGDGINYDHADWADAKLTCAGPTHNHYEAEAPASAVEGAALRAACGGCSGGAKVGYIGNGAANGVTLTGVTAPSEGDYRLEIHGLVDGSRSFSVSVNGSPATQVALTGTSWSVPAVVTVTVRLAAGANTLRFGNDTAYAPDLDKVVVHG